ncbi:MAG: hypothetical protein E7164_00980 [Firmicutes bacterium]|nr:hypothetical protein [Bacillota bacterium]
MEATSKTDVSVYENFATNLTTKECDALFGDPEQPGDLAYYLQKVLDVMKYLGIILCIVLTIVDFGKAILGEDKDMYKPLAKTAFNRLCYAVMLFLLPTIIETILRLIDVYGTCGIS